MKLSSQNNLDTRFEDLKFQKYKKILTKQYRHEFLKS